MQSAQAFIHAQTTLLPVSYLDDVLLYQAREADPVWRAVGEWMEQDDPAFPFWAFPWAGGLGLGRYILDHPESVQGLRVLDFAAGSGVSAILAAKAGARKTYAADIDPLSVVVTQMNAKANGVKIHEMKIARLDRPAKGVDVIIVGDICYEHTMSFRLLKWLRLCVQEGIRVVFADPQRAYAPKDGLQDLAVLSVPTSRELEDEAQREVVISEMLP